MTALQADELDRREQLMFTAIQEFVAEKGYAPSRKDLIPKVPPYNSESSTTALLGALRDKGLIVWEPRVPRSIRVLPREEGS